MRHVILLAMGLFLFPLAGVCQTTASDSKTLQDLLTEVRQLRHDLHTTTVTVQRGQILIHRVEAQEGAVSRAFQRLENAQTKLTEIHNNSKTTEAAEKQLEDLVSHTENQVERKQYELSVAELKAEVENSGNGEQESQEEVSKCEEQLRIEQGKLSELEERLDHLDKELENSSRIGGMTKDVPLIAESRATTTPTRFCQN